MGEPSPKIDAETPPDGALSCGRKGVIQSLGVRDATLGDLPAMLNMAERFIGGAWAHVGVPFCRDTCEKLLRGLLDSDDGILLLTRDGRGMMGAVVYPWHFNAAVLTGQELFWWSESPDGMALVDEAERQARELGAQTFNMACMDRMRSKALGRLYERRGYAPNEHIFIKALH